MILHHTLQHLHAVFVSCSTILTLFLATNS